MRPLRAPAIRWGALTAIVGSAVSVVGVFLDWATLTSAGSVLVPVEASTGRPGIAHWTGLIALLAAGMAFLGAVGAGFFADAPGRTVAGTVAAGAGLLLLIAVGLGLLQREGVATTGFPGGTKALEFARDFARGFNEELGLDIPPPRVEVGLGIPVTAAGGLLVLAGGLWSLRQERARRRHLHFGR